MKAFGFLICFTAWHRQSLKTAALGTVKSLWRFPFGKVRKVRNGFCLLPLLWASGSVPIASVPRAESTCWDWQETHKPPQFFFFFLHGHVTKAADCLKVETERSHGWQTGRIHLVLQMCPFQSQNYSLPGSSWWRGEDLGQLKLHGFRMSFPRGGGMFQIRQKCQMQWKSLWILIITGKQTTSTGEEKWPVFRVSQKSPPRPSYICSDKCPHFGCIVKEGYEIWAMSHARGAISAFCNKAIRTWASIRSSSFWLL